MLYTSIATVANKPRPTTLGSTSSTLARMGGEHYAAGASTSKPHGHGEVYAPDMVCKPMPILFSQGERTMIDEGKVTVHVLRTTSMKTGKPFWVAFDDTNRLKGKAGESKDALLKRWVAQFGKVEKVVSYTGGPMQPAEAACTISELQRKE